MKRLSLTCLSLLPFILFSQHNITGQVALHNSSSICNVVVELKNSNGELIDEDITGSDGFFTFENQAAEQDYQLSFSKVDNDNTGVGHYDISRIRSIIMSLHPPTNHDLWASDINGSGHISVFDLILMHKVFLNVQLDTSITTWVFDTPDVFPPNNTIEINHLTEHINLSVMGAKRGDIDMINTFCESND